MSKSCELCGKRNVSGNRVKRRGLAKKRGGAGRWIISKSKRVFKPNLQRVHALIDGRKRRIWVCTKCIKAGRVVKS